MRYAFLFPSIMGIQEGMGKDLAAHWAVARETFEEANDVLGYDFMQRCFTSSLEELASCSSLRALSILVVGVACQRILAQEGIEPSLATGMSIGLFPSLVVAKSLTFADAIRFLNQRGVLFDAVPVEQLGKVLAVITANENVSKQVEAISVEEDVPIALYNKTTQLGFAGTEEEIQRIRARLKKVRGVFIPKLDRFGILYANHSRHFKFMLEPWRELVNTLSIQAPLLPVALTGSDEITTDPQRIYDAIVGFDIRPSYWRQTFTRVVAQNYDLYLELGVNNTLTNLTRDWEGQPLVMPCGTASGIQTVLAYVDLARSKTA
jgi:[acyl-carrier-protein] S-malonyltransferase